MQVHVEQITAVEAHPVRRVVLRAGRPDVSASFPEDDLPSTIHVGAFLVEDGARRLVGVATFFPSPYADRPSDAAYQLRGMAVLPECQGTGVGAVLLDGGVQLVRDAGGTLLWAHGRDTALGFYERRGWKVVGDQYEYGPMKLAHHIVLLDLA